MDVAIDTERPTPLATAVRATKALITEMHTAERAAKLAEAGVPVQDESGDAPRRLPVDVGVVFTPDGPFSGGWLPEGRGAAWSLPLTYRDTTAFDDAEYVATQLHGADLAFFESLSLADNLVAKFVLLRRLNPEEAASRFLEFRRLVLEHDLSFAFDDPETQAGLQLGVFHFAPRVEAQAPRRAVVSMFPRKLDYDAASLRAVKKAWFFAAMSAFTWTPTVQTEGVIFCNSVKGVGLGCVKLELINFIGQAVNRALPVRVCHVFIANEPFIFGSVLWPLISRAFSEKLRSRVRVIGKDHGQVHAIVPPRCIPVELSGEWTTEGQEAVAQMIRVLGGADAAP